MESSFRMNTYGYVPSQTKRFLFLGEADAFEIIDKLTGNTAYSGKLTLAQGDELNLQGLREGVFTELTHPGCYSIKVNSYFSKSFYISDTVYGSVVWRGLNYLQQIRGGDGATGFRAWTHNISHLDDGLLDKETAEAIGLSDNWFDLVGGWYDATDVRYWTSSWMALEWISQVAEKLKPRCDRGCLLEELKWGNHMFLKTILPDGRVLNPCKSENYWTDNVIGSGDERQVAHGFCGGSMPCHLAYLQLRLSRLFKDDDPVYAGVMQSAGERILSQFAYLRDENLNTERYSVVDMALHVLASLEMYLVSKEDVWMDAARRWGFAIVSLQEVSFVGDQTEVRGFIYHDASRTSSTDMRAHEPVFLSALLELARYDSSSDLWINSLTMYCREYLLPLSYRNPYHLIPARVFTKNKNGRKLGCSSLVYRYFRPEGDGGNATGINPSLLGQSAVMMATGMATCDETLIDLAWQQLDFVLGLNPFGASTIEDVGYVPTQYLGGQGVTGTFPRIAGAVLNGLATKEGDIPILDDEWESSEYWLPQFGWLGWFLASAGVDTSICGEQMLPKTVVLKEGRKQTFIPPTCNPTSLLIWTVDGIPGGNSTIGIIVNGVYHAPEDVDESEPVHTVSVSDLAEGVLSCSQVRIVPEPGTPSVVSATSTGEAIRVTWTGEAALADSYNVELYHPDEGFWRIVMNTPNENNHCILPYTHDRRCLVRVTAVSHKYGYGKPSEAVSLDGDAS